MNFFDSLSISASALSATKTRINVASMNLANAQTTRTAEGTPYRKKSVVLSATPLYNPTDPRFQENFNEVLSGVRVESILPQNAFKRQYNPSHPDADAEGYITLPDINVIEEMANLMNIQRLYEANATAIEVTKAMYTKAIEIGK